MDQPKRSRGEENCGPIEETINAAEMKPLFHFRYRIRHELVKSGNAGEITGPGVCLVIGIFMIPDRGWFEGDRNSLFELLVYMI